MALNHNNNMIETSESFPLLSKRSNTDQSSNGTFLTCDSSTEESSHGSEEYLHQGPPSIIETSSIAVYPDETDLKQHCNESSSINNNNDDHDVGVGDSAGHHEDYHNESLPPLIEGVVEEFHEITEAILDELHKADENENYMIEMGLTRNLSLLHDDVVESCAVLYSNDDDDDNDDVELGDTHKKNPAETISSNIPLSAYVLLMSAIVAMSTVGPLLQLQDDASPTMKVVWRMAGTAIILSPLAISDVYHYGIPQLTLPQWITFLVSTLCYAVMSIGFCLALDFTAVGNAVILSNSTALVLLVGKIFTAIPTTTLELTGAVIAFGGAILCSRDAANATTTSDNDNGQIMVEGFGKTIVGDLLAITSAIGGVGYVTFAKTSRAHMPLYAFMFLTMSIGCVMILFFQVFVLQETVTWDRDVNHGIGGFLVWHRSDRLPLELTMVVICNLLGTTGYVRAMPHFDSIIICSVQLMEPVIAEFLSYFSGVGMLPGYIGWIGNIFVACGTLVIIYESQKKSSTESKQDVH